MWLLYSCLNVFRFAQSIHYCSLSIRFLPLLLSAKFDLLMSPQTLCARVPCCSRWPRFEPYTRFPCTWWHKNRNAHSCASIPTTYLRKQWQRDEEIQVSSLTLVRTSWNKEVIIFCANWVSVQLCVFEFICVFANLCIFSNPVHFLQYGIPPFFLHCLPLWTTFCLNAEIFSEIDSEFDNIFQNTWIWHFLTPYRIWNCKSCRNF